MALLKRRVRKRLSENEYPEGNKDDPENNSFFHGFTRVAHNDEGGGCEELYQPPAAGRGSVCHPGNRDCKNGPRFNERRNMINDPL